MTGVLRVLIISIFLPTLSMIFDACSGGSSKESSTKFQQYYVQGENLYLQHCSNYHQKDGTGLGLVYPPVNVSDFMDNHFEEVLCMMRFGREGEIIVNGKSYVQGMPAIPALTDLEIAEIATYIYNTWTHERGIVDMKEASEVMDRCKANTKI